MGMALAYNTMLYHVVQATSSGYTAFCSSFNKVALICFSLGFGFEIMPRWPWSAMFVIGAVGSISMAVLLFGVNDVTEKVSATSSPPASTRQEVEMELAEMELSQGAEKL